MLIATIQVKTRITQECMLRSSTSLVGFMIGISDYRNNG